jgi:hypothetical protein
MSNQERAFFDKYARGANEQNVSTTTYTETTIAQGGQTFATGSSNVVGGQTYVTGGSGVRGVTTGQTLVGQTFVGGPAYQTATYSTGPIVTGQTSVYNGQATDHKMVNQTFNSTTGGYSRIGQSLTQKVVAEEIPVESRIEYIPFEKKYIEYDQVERIERIPFEREIVEYEEVTRTERIPIERTITDYYAVETQIEYIPKEIEETIVEYEPVERVWERVQYLPVETQIVHYPERDNYVPGKGQYIKAGYAEGGYTTGYQQGASGVRRETVYQTGYVPVEGSVIQRQSVMRQGGFAGQSAFSQGGQYQYTTGQTYTTGPVYTTGQTTYTTGGYTTGGQTFVTGGSGVRGENVYRQSQTGGYVAGGSGVRH